MLLFWTALSSTDCQGIIIANQTNGVIESENFPNNYPFDARCSWTIQVTMGNTVNYTFTAFNLEGPFPSCLYDYVQVCLSWR